MDLHLEYPATPENAAKIAELMVEPAKRISKTTLDYSLTSLKDVDRIVRRMWREVGRSDRVTETIFGFGCYVGEVIIRNHGGTWRATETTPLQESAQSPLVLELEPGRFCSPVEQVWQRFQGSKGEPLYRYYHTVTGSELEETGTLGGFLDRLLGRQRT